MIVYCDQHICVWNEDGQCSGPKQPAGHTALYISETLSGQAICTDMRYKDGWEEEQEPKENKPKKRTKDMVCNNDYCELE